MNHFRYLAISCLFISLYPSLLFGSQSTLEIKIKAAYLYNFTKFVDWPDQKGKDPQICIVGDSALSSVLEELAAKQRSGTSFIVVSDSKINPSECQILYISNMARDMTNVLNSSKEQNILTVSDDERFSERGGMVTLFSENGKIRFEMNMPAIRKTNLQISSKLLELAKKR
ncbi:YfiR family protein [Sulfuricurvum sp.]|uniref:YfiR family protein n=1 Tax=Sulfuricurvum sp. TaxID=2025608 RepID=UPI002D31F240|nr:YfiR family protein [Sulfuricurvum sp.]HZF70423.1 YfiR family protein [Sulfuricurvum sp.]